MGLGPWCLSCPAYRGGGGHTLLPKDWLPLAGPGHSSLAGASGQTAEMAVSGTNSLSFLQPVASCLPRWGDLVCG